MTILASELKYYKSATVSDASGNGGRISATQVTTGVASNLFAAVQDAERVAGSTKYRKLFCKVSNDADETLLNGQVYLEKFTAAEDRITFFPATQTDTQAAITGAERQYGAGQLSGNISIGATTLDVVLESAAVAIFQAGDLIRISDKTDIDDVTGNAEFVTIDTSGAVYLTGDQVQITFTPALENAYLASVTRIASVYEHGDVEATISNLVVTTAGDGDFALANLLGDAIGGIEQTWTCTFTSATAFNIVGDVVGSVGSGTTGGGASPNNASFSKPYFVMQAAGFTGTFAAADTIVFQTHPAAVPVWVKRVVPADAAPALANSATIVLKGETA